MPSFCAVNNCNDRYGHSENISFHKFPLKRIDLLKQWEAFIQKQRGPDWHASRWSSLCSRHFREQDFRSLNERKTLKKSAVPTIIVTPDVQEKPNKKLNGPVSTQNSQKKEALAIQGIKERLEEVGNAAKSHCRLCGFYTISAATFQSNYKLFGILQKCLPTLNIQQEDTLPKTVCATCLKNLQQFGNFVDKILAAQEELQRKYRQRTSEKVLKIKQEPVVRVKQEAAEADNNQEMQHDMNFINNEDYDCTGEQPPDGETSDQKYDFCDFPIMGDCDITEIIDVNDPFISIPDDDTTSLNMETEQLQQQQQQQLSNRSQPTEGTHPHHLLSAHDLLQSHLLMEEHNYAYIETEDFKEESCFYKTEKTEGYEQSVENHTPITAHPLGEIFEINNNTTTHEATQPLPQSAFSLSNDNRAHKPIVTSVSAIQQPSKPNGIVVLNESIVKSGTGFQLHTCMVCQMKFFSIEALRQHYTQTHGTPMVGVPNIQLEEAVGNACKMENETNETSTEHTLPSVINEKNTPLESANSHLQETNNIENEGRPQPLKKKIKQKQKLKKKHINNNLNIMATHYQQLKKLYHKLQRKCLNLEQNVEQLQLQPKKILRKVQNKSFTEPFTVATNKTKKPQCPNRLPNDSKFECSVCLKIFSNANSLRQHKITHTEERKHICGLCSRSFKRRNGLLQHFKGFHLQVKPFSCAVCKHAYALKCDMLRCKHSVLKNGQHQ